MDKLIHDPDTQYKDTSFYIRQFHIKGKITLVILLFIAVFFSAALRPKYLELQLKVTSYLKPTNSFILVLSKLSGFLNYQGQ